MPVTTWELCSHELISPSPDTSIPEHCWLPVLHVTSVSLLYQRQRQKTPRGEDIFFTRLSPSLQAFPHLGPDFGVGRNGVVASQVKMWPGMLAFQVRVPL